MSKRYIVVSTHETEANIASALEQIGMKMMHYLGKGIFSIDLTEEQILVMYQRPWFVSIRQSGTASIC